MAFWSSGFPVAALVSVLTQVSWGTFVQGLGLGLAAAVPIGPVNVEIARRALQFGFRTGAALGLGAVTVDVIYAILSTFSFVLVLDRPAVILPIIGGGMLLLAFLGVQCLLAARAAWKTDPLGPNKSAPALPNANQSTASIRKSYLTGFLMTLLNPMSLGFWFTVVPTLAGRSSPGNGSTNPTSQAAGGDLPMMCAGVFLGTLSWVLFFSTLLALAGRAAGAHHDRRRRWLAIADLAGGVVLICFALAAGIRFWRRLGLVL